MSVICLTSQVTNELWIVWTGRHVIWVSRCSDWQKRVAVNNNRESQQTHWARLAMYMCSLLVSASYGFLFWGQKGFFFDCRTFQCAVLFSISQKVFNLMGQSDKSFGLSCSKILPTNLGEGGSSVDLTNGQANKHFLSSG